MYICVYTAVYTLVVVVVVEQRGSDRQRISLQICTRRIIYKKKINNTVYNVVDGPAGGSGTAGRVFSSPLRFIRYYYYYY